MTSDVPHLNPPAVWVIGEALVDIVTVDGVTSELPGGSPANVAYGLGRLGIDVALLSHLAHDARGTAILRHIENSGARVSMESMTAERTSSAAATLDETGAASYVFDIDWALPRVIAPPASRIIHTGSIASFLEPGATRVRELIAAAAADVIVTYDPNIRPGIIGARVAATEAFEKMASLATLVKLSDEDAGWLYPDLTIDEILALILELGPSLAVATRGGEGSILTSRLARIELAAEPVTVVDTIGAGDTYMASLLYSLLELDSREFSADVLLSIGRRAAVSAGITVSRSGAALPSQAEVTAALAVGGLATAL